MRELYASGPRMTGWSTLLLGVGLGIRHATDVDHLVVLSTLVQREPGIRRAVRLAALWGLGHTAAFIGLGLLVVLAELRIPSAFERCAELGVAFMLIGLGLFHLLRSTRSRAPSAGAFARPVLIGLVHGVAGSAGVALLAATTITSRGLAVAYLGLVALGTILGMLALTVLVARPIGWTMRREGRLKSVATGLAALLSVGLGILVLCGV